MQRAIVAPVDLASTALGELKDWLAITTTREDSALLALLEASLEMCEAFIRQAPIESGFEEVLPSMSGWQVLTTRPVRTITAVDAIDAGNLRLPLASDSYLLDLGADGTGRVRLTVPVDARRIAVRFSAGIAADWDTLPGALRHGIIRLAAHNFRERETSSASQPPAAITALWRPWRQMRLT